MNGWPDESGAVGAEANRLGKLHIISAWFRRINSSDVSRVKRLDIATIIADTPEYSVLEKLDLTLVAIDAKTPEPGQRSQFTPQNDYPLVYARSGNEAAFYIRQLAGLGYIQQETGIAMVLAPGFKRLMEMQKSGRTSAFVFVAMWFAEQMNDIYDNAIEPAIRNAGYEPIRVDRTEHVNRIDDEIIGRIKASRFIVADFTGHRQGVYFEAGMMLGLGRTVIWMCKDEYHQGRAAGREEPPSDRQVSQDQCCEARDRPAPGCCRLPGRLHSREVRAVVLNRGRNTASLRQPR